MGLASLDAPKARHASAKTEGTEAREGNIVVARIDPDATMKALQRIDRDTVELQPVTPNPEHETIRIDPTVEDCESVGIVVRAIVGTRRDASN